MHNNSSYKDCINCAAGIVVNTTIPDYPQYKVDGDGATIMRYFDLETHINANLEYHVLNKLGTYRYRGAKIKAIESDMLTCWQFGGTIYMNKNHLNGFSSFEEKADILRHEYGHYVQEKELGLANYFVSIAVPSFVVCSWDFITNSVSSEKYYSLPWECSADIYGGVKMRKHSITEIAKAEGYIAFWRIFR